MCYDYFISKVSPVYFVMVITLTTVNRIWLFHNPSNLLRKNHAGANLIANFAHSIWSVPPASAWLPRIMKRITPFSHSAAPDCLINYPHIESYSLRENNLFRLTMLWCSRNIPQAAASMRNGKWDRKKVLCKKFTKYFFNFLVLTIQNWSFLLPSSCYSIYRALFQTCFTHRILQMLAPTLEKAVRTTENLGKSCNVYVFF